ncbi:polysaccharide biosynthesis tyrosine autokinase [Sporosarcina sp.]|uniref:polysaccharide biosynthesis tyrosine autokinase n=1 Tax=Sporosarcina sp. TaxID=49982 RepID=UPI002634FA28|nr:polysaccharide biosynthesis tyrosine autokinase [Sporosarcina sp.]
MSNELNFNELFKIFKKRWKVMVAVTVLCTSAAIFVSIKAPPTYEARMDLLVNYTIKNDENAALQSSDIELSLKLIETYKQILKSDRMYGKVISKLGQPYSKSDLRDRILIETDGNSQIITIVAKEKTAKQAALLVNTYAISFQEEIKTLLNLENIMILDEISPVTDVKKDKLAPVVFASIVFITGLLLTIAIVLIREFYFTKLNTAEKAESILKIPNMGSIPMAKKKKRFAKKYVAKQGRDAWKEKIIPISPVLMEEFRRIRANIQFQMSQKNAKAIMMTSPVFGDGKSLISGNLAIVMAMDGKKTIFVDANLRESMGRKIFNLPNRIGLTSFLAGTFELDQIVQKTETDNLSFISSGPIPFNPAEVLSSDKMKLLIEKLKVQFDVIIIDAPPLAVADAISLSTFVDSCLYVINVEHTKGELAEMNLEHLRKVEAPILGTILNRSYSPKKTLPEL